MIKTQVKTCGYSAIEFGGFALFVFLLIDFQLHIQP
jgi:hypothetical protein